MGKPLEIYRARVADGDLKSDPAQEKAAIALDLVYEALTAETARPAPTFFQKIIGRGAAEAEPVRGLYLYGGVGRGKSMLMDLFYDALPENVSKRRVHFHEFMIGVHDYIHSRRSDESIREGTDEALPALAGLIVAQSHVLCFDEFHVTDITDAMILGRLFKILFEQGVVVVATSNWPPDRLYEGGLQRERFLPFIALLKEKMDVLHLRSPHDYRMGSVAVEGTYFSPLGRLATQAMDRVFEALTQGAEIKPDVIEVKGRAIAVRAAGGGCARFSFAQLCEQPHGAEDFIRIAQRYDTILIEHVPKMGYDRRNEAKRFMTLIDALYEAEVRVIISAAMPADKLYVGHDHAYEFQRTVSRLMEMQGMRF